MCFLLALAYQLCTPVFGDYHLLVFLAPLVLVQLEAGPGGVKWNLATGTITIGSILLLSAKNYGLRPGVLNALIAVAALVLVLLESERLRGSARPIEC